MSAIAGIFNLDGEPVARGLIEGLTGAMASRGPDGLSHWQEGPVALGHCLLRNTPESVDDYQPLHSNDNQFVLVFDGRLDNRSELLKELGLSGRGYGKRPDAEIVLCAYQHWLEDCPKRLVGDFAFAVWDQRRKRLFCARDHVGARQLCFFINRRFFAFASDSEALPALPGVSSDPCEELLAHFLAPDYQGFDFSQTWLKDVRTLVPAQSLAVTLGGLPRTEIYWRCELGEELKLASDDLYKEAFIDVFREAVESRLRSASEPAAMISGGMDSAAIAAMLGRLSCELPNGEYHSYSAISDDLHSSLESRCIESLTRQPHVVAHHVYVPSSTGMIGINDLLEAFWSQPHPVDSAIMLQAMMCLAASRNGHRVLLHGASGDITMHFYSRYISGYIRRGHWRTAWQECNAAAQNNTYLYESSPGKLFALNAWTGLIPRPARQWLSMLRKSPANSLASTGFLNPDFIKKMELSARKGARSVSSSVVSNPGSRPAHVDLIFGPSGVVSGLTGLQRVASRYGVELRDPWADRRVLEFFLHLPAEQQVRNGWTKYLARSAFESDLGQQVVWRNDKEHLGELFTRRLMSESDELIEHAMTVELDACRDYLNVDSIRDTYSRYKRLKEPVEMQNVYDIMTFILWAKRASAGLHKI